MTRSMARALLVTALVMLSAAPVRGQATDALVRARELYVAASYEEALRALGTLAGPEALQYRALCLLALGRSSEAEDSLRDLVQTAPDYQIAEADVPPRLMALFTQTRREILPAFARTLFAEARDDYSARRMDAAREKFELVLAIARDPALKDIAGLKDLELLGAGYLELTSHSPRPAPSAAASTPPAPTPPATSQSPTLQPATPQPVAGQPATTQPAAASTAATPNPTGTAAPPPAVVPAKAVHQDVPPYTFGRLAAPVTGSLRLVVGRDGGVKSAVIERSVDPRYDSRLLAAAREWRYTPATLAGRPVDSEVVVVVSVK